jgi:hypothetical protein
MSKIQYLPLDVEAMLQARQFSQSECLACVGLSELCPACQDLRDSRDAEIAHQIVDEGNLQYKHVWSKAESDVTAHDWVGSITKLIRPAIQMDGSIVEERYEFLDPISLIADRIIDLETSVTITPAEVVCQDCHLVYNKWSICPNCN